MRYFIINNYTKEIVKCETQQQALIYVNTMIDFMRKSNQSLYYIKGNIWVYKGMPMEVEYEESISAKDIFLKKEHQND